MTFLHGCPLRYHGRLKSSNCLVDNRWTLKVADFGVHAFCTTPELQHSDHEFCKGMCLRACVRACARARARVCVCVCVCVCARARLCVYAYEYVFVCVYVFVFAYVCLCVCICVCVYMCIWWWWWLLLYSVILRSLEQTHCAHIWFYMNDQLFKARFWIATEVVCLQL